MVVEVALMMLLRDGFQAQCGLIGICIVARDEQGAVLLASEGKGFIWRSNGLIAQLH